MLNGIDGVRNISDDIIIFAATVEEHDQIFRKVLQRMREWNITANKDKCAFRQESITYFGHNFSAAGVSPTEDRVKAIRNAEPPQNAAEVRSLLGMTQYLSRFVPNYSDVVKPLRDLTHSDTAWHGQTRKIIISKAKRESCQLEDHELFQHGLQN